MKRFFSVKRLGSPSQNAAPRVSTDNPEFNAPRGVRLFCESSNPTNGGDEVTHLPIIVESSESSPAAAAAAAYQIRRYLSKDGQGKPHVQYNAIMLIRILADNPGPTFTQNIDSKFVKAVKDILKFGQDPSVRNLMVETLDALERDKASDGNLVPLMTMWKSEKARNPPQTHYPRYPQPAQIASSRGPRPLPTPDELAARIEEARTSAKLLIQFCQATPAGEFASSDLIREFSERCHAAQKNLQSLMNNTNPSPDELTLQTLIETSEQLSLAISKYQRAKLAYQQYSRAHQGLTIGPGGLQPGDGSTSFLSTNSQSTPPIQSPPVLQQTSKNSKPVAFFNVAEQSDNANPFDDKHRIAPQPHMSSEQPGSNFTGTNDGTRDPSYNYGRAPAPEPGTVELPTTLNNLSIQDHATQQAAKTDFAPPSGPPPNHDSVSNRKPAPTPPPPRTPGGSGPGVRTQVEHNGEDDEDDLYSTSPVAARQETEQEVSDRAPNHTNTVHQSPFGATSLHETQNHSQSQSLYGIQGQTNALGVSGHNSRQELLATPSYIHRQDEATAGYTMSGGASSPPRLQAAIAAPPAATANSSFAAAAPLTSYPQSHEPNVSSGHYRKGSASFADSEGRGWGDASPGSYQYANGNGNATTGPKVKDDDPFTPTTSASGAVQ